MTTHQPPPSYLPPSNICSRVLSWWQGQLGLKELRIIKKNKQWTTLVYLVNIGIRNLAKVVSKVLSSPYDDSELYFLSEIGEFDQIPFFTLTWVIIIMAGFLANKNIRANYVIN